MGWWRRLRQWCCQPKPSSADRTNRRRWPPFCYRSTSGSLCPSSVYVSDAAHNSLHNIVKGHVRRTERKVHLDVIGVEMVFKTVGFYGLAERSRVDREQLGPQHWALGHTEPSACSGWWQPASYPPGRTGTSVKQYQPPPGRERLYAVAPDGQWCRMLLIGQTVPAHNALSIHGLQDITVHLDKSWL